MGNRLSKIYTRTGDDGSTGLGDGSRVAKDSARVTAYGTVDEANSAIGIVLATDIPAPVRDVLVAQVPAVLQRELYAVAALAGAIVLVAGRMADLPAAPAAIAGALTCFGLRWMAIRRGWRLPVAK